MNQNVPSSVVIPSSALDKEIDDLKKAVAGLQKTVQIKTKDGWDKAGVVAQFLSGVVIALLGIVVTIYVQSRDAKQKAIELTLSDKQTAAQRSLSAQQSEEQMNLSDQQSRAQLALAAAHDKAQLDLENRQNFATFLDKLLDATDAQKRAELLGQVEVELTPEQAIQVAMDYVHPPLALMGETNFASDNLVFNKALLLVDHLKAEGGTVLRQISKAQLIPESEIAIDALGGRPRVLIRASDIDDFADLTLNGNRVLPTLTFGEDSGWIDITKKLKSGTGPADVNELRFTVANGPYGGYGGRFEISAGTQQYDTGPYAVNSCPCNKPAFQILAHLSAHANGKMQILDTKVTTFTP